MNVNAALRSILNIVENPTSNLTAAVLLMAMVTLLVLVIIIALLLVVTRRPGSKAPGTGAGIRKRSEPSRSADDYEYPELSPLLPKREPGKAEEEPAKPERARRGLGVLLTGAAFWWLVAILLAVALVSGYALTSQDSFCLESCHAGQPETQARAKSAHAAVRCVQCHEAPGLSQVPAALIQRSAHLLTPSIPSVSAYGGAVPSRVCLGCHRDITDRAIESSSGVRVLHSHPLAAGMSCSDCHVSAGHGAAGGRVPMAQCVRCHDGKTAPAGCSTCHTKDTGKAVASLEAQRLFGLVQLGPVTDCGGCHSQAKCDACHGLRLPHPAEFVRWEHARQSAFGRKQVCYRCHTIATCSKCHLDFSAHGGQKWIAAHRTSEPKCVCHWVKLPADAQPANGRFCPVCH
ncbi:MAG TPA: hypothetical protein VF902_04520 [Coriobacteriia bacterium]